MARSWALKLMANGNELVQEANGHWSLVGLQSQWADSHEWGYEANGQSACTSSQNQQPISSRCPRSRQPMASFCLQTGGQSPCSNSHPHQLANQSLPLGPAGQSARSIRTGCCQPIRTSFLLGFQPGANQDSLSDRPMTPAGQSEGVGCPINKSWPSNYQVLIIQSVRVDCLISES